MLQKSNVGALLGGGDVRFPHIWAGRKQNTAYCLCGCTCLAAVLIARRSVVIQPKTSQGAGPSLLHTCDLEGSA
jgi:hypothetical protein